MQSYAFPMAHLRTDLISDREPLVLVLCGSFNPITSLHLHLFSSAIAFCHKFTAFEVVGCYLSPVSDAYGKYGLVASMHRLRMAELATEEPVDGVENGLKVMVDPWESLQQGYTTTARVLDHFDHEINGLRGGVDGVDGRKRKVKIALLAGADLVLDMSTPGRWSREDLGHIFGQYGVFVVERSGTDIEGAIAKLKQAKVGENIWKVEPTEQNDVSSTKVRSQLRRGLSVEDIPSSVDRYIEKHGLYKEQNEGAQSENNVAKQ